MPASKPLTWPVEGSMMENTWLAVVPPRTSWSASRMAVAQPLAAMSSSEATGPAAIAAV